MAKKRYRDHAADMDRAVVALDSDAAQAAVKAMRNGLARGQGLRTRPQSAVSQLCDQLAAQFPKEIGDFKRGNTLPGKRLRVMVENVTGRKPTVRELGAIRRQLTRQFRGGVNAAKLKRDHLAAKALKVRAGRDLRYRETYPAPGMLESLPGLKRIKISK